MLVKELVYSILDLMKTSSDDSYINEYHVLFLCKKYRAFLIKKEQEKKNMELPSEFEYQQICLDLEKVPAIDGSPCLGGYYLKSTQAIPKILSGTIPQIYPVDYYQGIKICFIPRERMKYVGTNKFLQNIIYTSIGPDKYLYVNSNNPQFLYLKKLRINALFEDVDEAAKYACDDCGCPTNCDPFDAVFPIRDYLIPTLIELVLRELSGTKYQTRDIENNAKDDTSVKSNAVNPYTNSLTDNSTTY